MKLKAALFLVTLLFAGIIPRAALSHAAVSDLIISESCVPGGHLQLNFGWRGSDPLASQQWLDLSLQDNAWQGGTFISAGPLTPDRSSFAWSDLPQDTEYFVRVNQMLADGAWDPSRTFYFTTASCVPA